MSKLFCLATTEQQANSMMGALTARDVHVEIRGSASGTADYLMTHDVPDFVALEMESAVRQGARLLELSFEENDSGMDEARKILSELGAESISPAQDQFHQQTSSNESPYAHLDYESTWDAIDSKPHDAYADGARFMFDSGAFDVGENYPRGV